MQDGASVFSLEALDPFCDKVANNRLWVQDKPTPARNPVWKSPPSYRPFFLQVLWFWAGSNDTDLSCIVPFHSAVYELRTIQNRSRSVTHAVTWLVSETSRHGNGNAVSLANAEAIFLIAVLRHAVNKFRFWVAFRPAINTLFRPRTVAI